MKRGMYVPASVASPAHLGLRPIYACRHGARVQEYGAFLTEVETEAAEAAATQAQENEEHAAEHEEREEFAQL